MTRHEALLDKIVSRDKLTSRILAQKVKGKSIVFTNGVFDILHTGHVTLLSRAAEKGHFLIVGLNSDQSVKTLNKGPERPINSQNDRAILLAALQCVDAVVIFDEPTPYEIIKLAEPDVLVKGGDYDAEQTDASKKNYIVGSDLQKERGKKTVAIPLVEGYSTTALIKKLNG